MSTARSNPKTHTRQVVATLDREVLTGELDGLLNAMIACQREMLDAGRAHREGIRQADGNAIEAAISTLTTIQSRSRSLDQRRRELVARAASSYPGLGSKPATQITLTDLAGQAPSHDRAALLEKIATLRTIVTAVDLEARTLRAAATSLMAHMEGLVRHVGRTLSHAGTYGPRGVVDSRHLVVSSLDLSS